MEGHVEKGGSIRLLTLEIENFKGIKTFKLDLGGMDGEIYATNGTGKTSLADAYFWLLTGKDSAGGMPGDKLFPVGAPAGVAVAVNAGFSQEGGPGFSLGRLLKRKIQRARGEAEAAARGTSTEYSINGVVKPQREYNAFIEEHFGDERTLRLLSDHRYFGESLHWEERRGLLIQGFAPQSTEQEVIQAHLEELGALEGYIGAMHTVEELEGQQRLERRKLQKKLEEIPSRIDEVERGRPLLPEPGEASQLPSLAKRRAALLVELDNLRGGGAIAQAQGEAAACLERLNKAKAEYLAQNRGGNEDLERQCAELRKSIQEAQANIATCQRVVHSAQASLEVADQELAQLRQEANDIHYRAFPADAAACPTCGQPLPLEKLEELRAQFNEKRARDMADNRARGLACAQSCRDLESIMRNNTEKSEQQEGLLKDLQARLAEAQGRIVEPAPFEDTPVCQKLARQLEEAEQACAALRESAQPQIEAKKRELAQVDGEIEGAKNAALLAAQAEKAGQRIQELQEEETRLGLALQKCETLLAATERFVELQAADIEGQVNGAFSLVRWQLFEKQVNGGTAPCCKALVGGVAWESGINALNTAARVNAGLDIINTFARALGRSLPVWVDNAESIADCLPAQGQCIQLAVSPGDPALRVETTERGSTIDGK